MASQTRYTKMISMRKAMGRAWSNAEAISVDSRYSNSYQVSSRGGGMKIVGVSEGPG